MEFDDDEVGDEVDEEEEEEEIGEENNSDDDNDEDFDLQAHAIAENVNSPQSSLTFGFSRGSHGQLVKTQQHPRKGASQHEKKNKMFKKFADRFFSGNMTAAAENVAQFKKAPKKMQYGMLMQFTNQKDGMSQSMCKSVYNVGANAWKIAKSGVGPKKQGGAIRNDLVSGEQLAQLKRMFDPDNPDALPIELGFACAHGRQGKSATTAKTWADVYKHFLAFEPNSQLRKMKSNTFYRYAKATERDFHLKSLKTDACDVCERIRIELLDLTHDAEERAAIEEQLLDHQQATRTQRLGLKEYIKRYGKESAVVEK